MLEMFVVGLQCKLFEIHFTAIVINITWICWLRDHSNGFTVKIMWNESISTLYRHLIKAIQFSAEMWMLSHASRLYADNPLISCLPTEKCHRAYFPCEQVRSPFVNTSIHVVNSLLIKLLRKTRFCRLKFAFSSSVIKYRTSRADKHWVGFFSRSSISIKLTFNRYRKITLWESSFDIHSSQIEQKIRNHLKYLEKKSVKLKVFQFPDIWRWI